MWVKLEPIIQNEVSQKEKNKYILTVAWHRNNCEEIPHLQWQRSPSKMVGTGAAATQGKNNMSLKDEFPRSVGAQYAAGDQWRNNSRKTEETEPKQNQHPVVDVTGHGSKVQCCKEQHCIGTWNVRSMNQGKSEVFKQEMARVNIDILAITELKWTGIDEFKSDDHYTYYCGQESLRRMQEPS